MVKINITQVILIAITLIIISIVLPIGLSYIGSAGQMATHVVKNATLETYYTLSEVVDPVIITLFTILLPILVVIGIIMYFIPKMKD